MEEVYKGESLQRRVEVLAKTRDRVVVGLLAAAVLVMLLFSAQATRQVAEDKARARQIATQVTQLRDGIRRVEELTVALEATISERVAQNAARQQVVAETTANIVRQIEAVNERLAKQIASDHRAANAGHTAIQAELEQLKAELRRVREAQAQAPVPQPPTTTPRGLCLLNCG